MPSLYDIQAPKRSANLSVNEDLLTKARAQNINLSAALEQALTSALREKQLAQWLSENKAAIEAYNEHVEQHSVFSDGLRSF